MEKQASGPTSTHGSKSEDRRGDLQAILYLLQSHLEKMKDEVDRSYALNAIGEDTELIKGLQTIISDPFKAVVDVSQNVDIEVTQLLNKIVSGYLKSKKEKSLVQSAYRTQVQFNHLHYTIILENDSNNNRVQMMEFFDWYLALGIDERFPVTFQFIPEILLAKINTAEKIA